jgi:hypothetical protein
LAQLLAWSSVSKSLTTYLLSPPIKKLGFVCIWFSFAFALFQLNRQHKRRTFDSIPNFGIWQAAVLGKQSYLKAVELQILVSNVLSKQSIKPCLK